MTTYENLVSLYELFHRSYGWTVNAVDAAEMEYLLTLLRVKALAVQGTKLDCELHFIDEVL